MKLVLLFEVEVDEAGHARYAEEFPAVAEDGESAADSLIREAIAAWETEGLVVTVETWASELEAAAS